jgi:hypothetical protein
MFALQMQTPGQLTEPGVVTNLRFSSIYGIAYINKSLRPQAGLTFQSNRRFKNYT